MNRGLAIGLSAALLAVLAAGAAQAELRASLENKVISENETVQLTVRLLGDGEPRGEPDFSALRADFDVLTTRTATEFGAERGQLRSWTAWILTLQPKRTGRLRIPSFRLGDDETEPIELRVEALDTEARAFVDRQLYFETELSPEAVYVQAQLLFTRTLYYADGVHLLRQLPRDPEIPDALVQPLGDVRITRAHRNGQRYRVVRQRYAIFPERSGTLAIPSASAAGSTIMPRAKGFSGRRVAVEARTGELRVAVRPIPAEYPSDAPWLPAAGVELEESWDAEPHVLDAGRPMTRRVTVRVREAMASMVPPLSLQYPDALRHYAGTPELEESAGEDGVTGRRTETDTLLAHGSGSTRLPSMRLTWFDTEREEVRQARLPSRQVRIRGAARPQADASPPVAAEAGRAAPPGASRTPASAPRLGRWFIFAALLALLAGGWYYRGRLLAALRRLASHDALARWRAERRAYHELKQALSEAHPANVKPALARWLRHHYRRGEAAAWRAFTDDPEGRRLADELNAALFAPQGTGALDAATLAAHVARLRAGRARRHRRREDPIPPLYPGEATQLAPHR